MDSNGSTSTAPMKQVQIYTDGACRGNPGPGGWGAILSYLGHEREISGGDVRTTNNRMELTAAIQALQALQQRCQVTLFTDSQYLRNGITTWIHQWKRNNWRRKGRSAVKNVDLWQQLDQLNTKHEITWIWVRGHDGDVGNERADELARKAIPDSWS